MPMLRSQQVVIQITRLIFHAGLIRVRCIKSHTLQHFTSQYTGRDEYVSRSDAEGSSVTLRALSTHTDLLLQSVEKLVAGGSHLE